MIVRYQAEDKPNTVKPTPTRGVSALTQGSRTVLMPENSERMARRHELNVLKAVHQTHDEQGCCNDETQPDPKLRPHSYR
jgi:hypothetical protein